MCNSNYEVLKYVKRERERESWWVPAILDGHDGEGEVLFWKLECWTMLHQYYLFTNVICRTMLINCTSKPVIAALEAITWNPYITNLWQFPKNLFIFCFILSKNSSCRKVFVSNHVFYPSVNGYADSCPCLIMKKRSFHIIY